MRMLPNVSRGTEREFCAPEAPDRCQEVTSRGQCVYKAQVNSQYCKRHDSNREEIDERKAISLYALEKKKIQFDRVTQHNAIKSTRDEIGLLRVMIENRWNACEDDHCLILASAGIADLITKVERAVFNCHRMEENLGEIMDKQRLLKFTDRVINLLAESSLPQSELEEIAKNLMDEF